MKRKFIRIVYYVFIILTVWLITHFFLRGTQSPDVIIYDLKLSNSSNNSLFGESAKQPPENISDGEIKENPNDHKFVPLRELFKGSTNDRQVQVVKAFKHAWSAYKKYAWGHDELRPVTKTPHNWLGVGVFIVDCLDTAFIMNLTEEYNEGRQWISKNLNFTTNVNAQMFEVVIRALGGLMSLYYLTDDVMYLEKAKILGDHLYPCISRIDPAIPCSRFHVDNGKPSFGSILIAEVGTIQLEFTALSRATGDPKYEEAVLNIAKRLHKFPKLGGLLPVLVQANGNLDNNSALTLGGGGDSYYEYLLKQWLQTGKKTDWLLQDYLESVKGVQDHLLKRTKPNNYAFLGIKPSRRSKAFINKMEHLACFYPGTLVLGHIIGIDNENSGLYLSHLQLAKDLVKTCYEMYNISPTKLSPDESHFNVHLGSNSDFIHNTNYAFYIHRPETLESIFYMYYATHNKTYQDWGWNIFQGIEKYTKLPEGYASLTNVFSSSPSHRNSMETFFLAETLKYLFLLFYDKPDHVISLHNYVFNTEAHLLPNYI